MFMIGNGRDDGIDAIIFPVKTVHIPLNTMTVTGFCTFDYSVVIVAIWWPKKNRSNSSEFFYFIVNRLDFFYAFRGGELRHLFMVLAVVS